MTQPSRDCERMMDIEESAERIFEARESIGDLFYEIFLDEFPEMQKYFVDTNFKRQGMMLTLALALAERFYSKRSPLCRDYLRSLGSRHDERQIPREEYRDWTTAMMTTLARYHGDDWSESLARQWKEAIELAIEEMMEGYCQP